MYRLRKKTPDSHKNGRHPARAIAIERPSKGRTSRGNLLIGTVEQPPADI